MKIIKIIFTVLSILWTLISISTTLILMIPLFLITVWLKKKLFLNFTLLAFSTIMSVGLFPMGFLYTILKVLITEEAKREHLSKYIRKVTISDDQKGNVVLGTMFNDMLITKNGYKYGNEDETISSATGRNVEKDTLLLIGKKLNAILSVFEENHSVNSIEN